MPGTIKASCISSVIRTRGELTRWLSRIFSPGVDADVCSIGEVQPLHVAAWVELQARENAAPTANKQRLTYDVSHSTILRLTA